MKILGESSEGIIEFNDGNELFVDSKVNDPAKLRIGMMCYPSGGGGGAISFDIKEGNVREEVVMIHGEQCESVRGNVHNYKGELGIFVNDGKGNGDPSMIRCITVRHDSIEFNPDLIHSLRNQLQTGEFSNVGLLGQSNTGRTKLYMQGDGNLVIYLDDKPIWNSGTVEPGFQ